MIGFRVAVLIALLTVPSQVFAAGFEAPKVDVPPLQSPPPIQSLQPLQPAPTVIVVPPVGPAPAERSCHAECDHSIPGCSANDVGNNCPRYCMRGGCD